LERPPEEPEPGETRPEDPQPEQGIVPAEEEEVLEGELQEQVEQTVERLIGKFHRGPLPTPEDFEGYERTLVGAAREIMDMARSEQAFRHDVTRQIVVNVKEDSKRGMNYALIVALVGFVLVFGLALLDQPILAGVIGALEIASIAIAFIVGRSGDD
jgi:uncharacterized membrane protein